MQERSLLPGPLPASPLALPRGAPAGGLGGGAGRGPREPAPRDRRGPPSVLGCCALPRGRQVCSPTAWRRGARGSAGGAQPAQRALPRGRCPSIPSSPGRPAPFRRNHSMEKLRLSLRLLREKKSYPPTHTHTLASVSSNTQRGGGSGGNLRNNWVGKGIMKISHF